MTKIMGSIFYQWLSVNILLTFIFAILVLNGFVANALESDSTYITFLIIFAHFAVMIRSGINTYRLSKDIDKVTLGTPTKWSLYSSKNTQSDYVESLKHKLTANIAWVTTYINSIVILGLVGTVIGFMIALGALDNDMLGDVNVTLQVVSVFTYGAKIALYTTIAGALSALWMSINHHFLKMGTVELYSKILEQ